MSIFDEVSGRYRAPRLEDLPPPPEPSIWRKAQQGLSEFMDSPWGAAVEVPLTVVTAPQRAVESAIGAFRGGFELSEAEREAYGKEAYDRDAAVPKFGGGESIGETAMRRLRGRAYTAPTGGQIAREAVAGAGELLGAPSTATVMGLSRDGTQAGGYRPIAESEQKAFEQESPVLSRVAAPLRVGTEFAGSLATDPTSLLAFGPKLAAAAGGTIAKEAAESALRSAALETAKAERLASRLFVPGAITGAVGGTLEAGRAISEDGLFSPEAIEATLGAGVATGMGALAGRNAFRGLDSLPKPPGMGERSLSVEDLPPPPQMRPFDVPAEPDRYAYRARTVGEQGIPAAGHAQASLSEQDVRRMAPSRTEDPQEVVRVDLKGLGPEGFESTPGPSGDPWVRFKAGLPEERVERVGELTAIDRAAADKATPPVRAAVESADVADLAQATGLTMERAKKGADDVRADGVRELSPEAVAIKKTVLQSDPAMLEAEKPVDLRLDPTEPLTPTTEPVAALPEQKLSTESVQPPEAIPSAVGVDNIRKAFPTGKITDNEGAWEVRLPGNRNIRVTPTGDVAFSLGDLQKGHPDAATAEGLKPGMQVVGSWQRIGRGGLISLAKEAGQGTLDHETFHAAMDLVLSEREKKAILKRFKTEEAAADAYGAWTPAEKSNAVFAKMAAFFQRLYRNLFPNADSVFGKVRTGEAFDRTGNALPDVPLPPIQRAAPEQLSEKEAGFRTTAPRPANEFPPVTGRSVNAKEPVPAGIPKDAGGNAIYPGQEGWTPEERAVVHDSAKAIVGDVVAGQRAQPTGRQPILGGVARNNVEGYIGTNSAKSGTALEALPYTPSEMQAALDRDKGNRIELDIHEAVRADERVAGALEDAGGDASFDFGENERRTATPIRAKSDRLPRVEQRVENLEAATADAGVPDLPLDRDTVQSWESLDPKVKKILNTHSEQDFFDIMKTRNLNAAETQAYDAVIKGKEQRLERLKSQERTPETDREIAAETLGYIAAQRAYINDGTGLARALAARARVMSAANPAEAFARKVETFKIPKAKASNIVAAFKKDPGLLEALRARAAQSERKLSVAEGPVKYATEGADPLLQRMLDAGLTPEEAASFLDGISKDASVFGELEAAVKGPEQSDVLLKKVFKEIKGVSDEQAAEILTAFKENPDNLAPLLQSAFGANKIRKALEWWRAGLLSSFSTDMANVSGNIAEHHIRLAETGVASAVDWMLQKVYGGDRARFAGEVGAEMAGANMAFGPALKNLARNMLDVFKLKDNPLDLSRKLEGQFGAIGGTTGKVVRAIGYGRMGAEDVFFKEWGGGAEAMKLAYRKAANSLPAGTSKAEIRAKAKQIIDEMSDPENTAHSDVVAQVETAKLDRTFQERRVGSLTDAISGVVRRNPMLSFVAPFVNTPGNIANAIIKRSPLGAKRAVQAFGEFKKAQSDFSAGRIDEAAFAAARGKLADAIASPLMGTAMLAGFTLYANAGGMTGSGPTDDRAKNALKESGWSPYSFVFTDPTSGKKAYIPFNRFEPISSLLGFAADMAEAKNVRNLSLFDKALGSVVENLTSKSYLTGLSEAASLITKPKEFAPQYIKGFVGSWVPNIIGKTAAAIDPIQRDTRASASGFAGLPEAIGKNIQSRIPFASKALPARMSSTGRPVERAGNALTRFASPTQPTIEKPELYLEREYGRLGWAPTAPSRNVTVKGVQTSLEDSEFDVMTKATRRASDEARNLIRSPHYKSLPDDQRELLLDRIYSKWKARGRQSIRAKLERRVAREARP